MERVHVFLARHFWAQLLLGVLGGAVLVQLLYPQGSFGVVLVRTAVMSVGGVCVALAMRRKERRAAGSTDGLISLDRRLRTGDVPADPAERQAMRRLVDQRLHRTRHRRAALAFLTCLFVGITVLTALTAGPRQTIGFAIVTVVFLSWMSYAGSLNNRRLHTMDAALGGAPAGLGSPATDGTPLAHEAVPGPPHRMP
ncbi:hypothetical protein ABII15_35225 [Streptomyces sp. HUAS MG91]|uniref:Integral membrane protein n=1 Tax=Streptomyces tabacisoli TaxID=3156398 RepID=A0AAU8J4S2_9ACTN